MITAVMYMCYKANLILQWQYMQSNSGCINSERKTFRDQFIFSWKNYKRASIKFFSPFDIKKALKRRKRKSRESSRFFVLLLKKNLFKNMLLFSFTLLSLFIMAMSLPFHIFFSLLNRKKINLPFSRNISIPCLPFVPVMERYKNFAWRTLKVNIVYERLRTLVPVRETD